MFFLESLKTGNGIIRIDVWTGSNTGGGDGQTACEDELTPEHGVVIMRGVGPDLEVDSKSFYALH